MRRRCRRRYRSNGLLVNCVRLGINKATYGKGPDVRNNGEVGAVTGFEEKCHAGNQAEHGVLVVAVGDADGDEEGAADDGDRVQPDLLGPDAVGFPVDKISDETTERAEGEVQETEHSGPVSSTRLAENGEVLEVVGAKGGVDG